MKNNCIGIFDSGIGGINVLNSCLDILPNENFIYYADSLNSPYGDKTKEDLINLMDKIMVDVFIPRKIKALVIACNTATNNTIDYLRSKYDIPIIGIEPAVKKATENNKRKILIIATEATIKSDRLKRSLKNYNEDIFILMPCSGLVELIEENNMYEVEKYLKNKFKDLDLKNIDAVVLGCTHYSFIKQEIKNVININNKIQFFDGNNGVAKRLKNILEENNLRTTELKNGSIYIDSSMDDNYNKKIYKYIKR